MPDELVGRLGRGPLQPGNVLAGRFRLKEKLGDGAMGQVFVAENMAMGIEVAIKVLRTELLADASFRRRFQHEADAIAAIQHRNVARFLDLVVGDPTFLVMEYVKGHTLDDALEKEGPLAPKRAARLAVRILWGLEAAHAAGVIHRDIKPANILLASDVESGEEPKLIDFGLAKLASATVEAGLTRTGQIVGTPEYMAPEQVSGGNVDPRADVYAVGCLLYELLVGRPPFSGDDDVQVLYAQVHHEPPSLAKAVPGLPPRLVQIVNRALAKEPDKRFATAREMAAALDAFLAEEARGPARGARPEWVVAGVVAAALAGATLGVGGAWLALRHPTGAQSGTLLILNTSPPGAKVTIDGNELPESTPTAVRDLPPGSHVVRLERGKLQTVERRVTLSPDERTLVNVSLPPASRTLEVHSIPEGATVYVDGHLAIGETPSTLEVTVDDFHELRFERPGYETAVRALTPDETEASLTVKLEPERLPRGTVVVDSNVTAEVWIDGVPSGFITPTLGIQLPAGEHLIEARDGPRRASTRIKLGRGQTVRLLLSPGAAAGGKGG